MDASREPAGQRAGSRRTSSALWMEFSSNTGMCFRTRLRKRNPRVVDLCSETVSPSHAETNPSPIFTSRFAERCDAGSPTTRHGPNRTFLLNRNEERTTMRGDMTPGTTVPESELQSEENTARQL